MASMSAGPHFEIAVAERNGRPERSVVVRRDGKEVFRDVVDTDRELHRRRFVDAIQRRGRLRPEDVLGLDQAPGGQAHAQPGAALPVDWAR